MRKILITALLSFMSAPLIAVAGDEITTYKTSLSANADGSFPIITKIYSQNLMYFIQPTFTSVLEKESGGQYIREYVPNGESTTEWSQMITITGAKNIASVPGITPQFVTTKLANGFKNDCPETFHGTDVGSTRFSGFDAHIVALACGISTSKNPKYSEQTIVIAIKGDKDFYTIQWAEKGPASSKPPEIDFNKLKARTLQLMPVRLCAANSEDSPPFSGCLKPQAQP